MPPLVDKCATLDDYTISHLVNNLVTLVHYNIIQHLVNGYAMLVNYNGKSHLLAIIIIKEIII